MPLGHPQAIWPPKPWWLPTSLWRRLIRWVEWAERS